MVTDYTYRGEQCIMYKIVELSIHYCTSETNITLYVSYNEKKRQKQKKISNLGSDTNLLCGFVKSLSLSGLISSLKWKRKSKKSSKISLPLRLIILFLLIMYLNFKFSNTLITEFIIKPNHWFVYKILYMKCYCDFGLSWLFIVLEYLWKAFLLILSLRILYFKANNISGWQSLFYPFKVLWNELFWNLEALIWESKRGLHR